jgi:septum site-determining protein MinC
MNASLEAAEAACDLRFGQVGIACVRVRRADAAAICEDLERRVRAAPKLFERTAVVLDLSHLSTLPDDGIVDAMLEAVRSAGMMPVGFAYGTAEMDALAQRMGMPIIAKFREAYDSQHTPAVAAPVPASRPEAPSTAAIAPATVSRRQEQPVRSGQQLYARASDLVVLASVANGAEVLADGSIHIYGTLRGRALAGAQGDTDARIYCSDFRAELISIAGHYRVFEQIPQEFEGQPVQCWLEGEKLLIARL